MKHIHRSLLAAGIVLSAGAAQAAPFQVYGYIVGVKTVNGNQFVDLYQHETGGDRPACHTNEVFDFRLDQGSDAVMAEILRQGADLGNITVTGSGTCSGNTETIKAINFQGAMPPA